MKKPLLIMLGLLVFICLNAHAQRKPVSAQDQQAIVKLFKGVDPKLYHLEFNGGRSTYGRKISMGELQQAQTIRNHGGNNADVVLAVRDDGVMFIFAATGKKLTDVLGAQKAAQLNTIMAKYSR